MESFEFSEQEKLYIIVSQRQLAIAQAVAWDVLRQIELAHDGLELETDIYLTSELAAECNIPPSPADLSDEMVWESFEQHATAKHRQRQD